MPELLPKPPEPDGDSYIVASRCEPGISVVVCVANDLQVSRAVAALQAAIEMLRDLPPGVMISRHL